MTLDTPQGQNTSFQFLRSIWPELYDLGEKAERAAAQEPDLAAIRLRGLTEAMVEHIFKRMDLPWDREAPHFDRLKLLEREDLLDARLLAKFHAIRKIGNNAAHNRGATRAQAESLLEDAWSLAAWFCPFMRPDIEWLIPARSKGLDGSSSPQAEVPRESIAPGRTGQILQFPEERIRRIREAVAKAMSYVDPSVRQLRTRITMREAFGDELTADQENCVAALESFLENRDQRVFLLKGYAGTGKTFLAKGLTEFLLAQGRSFRLAAPTGRAAKVISEKTGLDARTLHSLIYNYGDLQEYTDDDQTEGSETFKIYAAIAGNREQANTVYIVDEASMVSDVYSESAFFRAGTGYLLQDLFTYVNFDQSENDRKVIFIGDPAQLAPVGMSSSPALDTEYLHKAFGAAPMEYELKQVVRQKAESGVLRNVMPLRDGLTKGSFGGPAIEFGEDVVDIRADELVPLYMNARERAGPDAPIIITHSNAEAAEFNRAIRRRLFPDKDFVTVADRLIVTSNTLVDGKFLANGEFVKVAAVETTVERRTVTLRRKNSATGKVETDEVALTFRDLQLAVPLADGTEALLDAKILDDHLHGTDAGLSEAQQSALFVDFNKRHPHLQRTGEREARGIALRQDPYFNALRVKFGYAVTCHKAQGGEWSDVFVNCRTRQNPRTADYYRWLYTALTRASGKLYLIPPPEIRIRVAGPVWWPEREGQGTASTAAPAPAVAPPAGVETSPLEAFRDGVLATVRTILANTGIEIVDIAHYPYREAYFLRRDADAIRADIVYNSKSMITRAAALQSGPLGDEIGALLAPLVGQVPGASPQPAGAATPGHPSSPSRPFLKKLHDQLLPLLEAKQIRVASLKEQQWSQRYSFERGTETAVVDIFYNGKDRFTKCLPIIPTASSGKPAGALLREVLEIVTSEVHP